jgi:hypothetical protein
MTPSLWIWLRLGYETLDMMLAQQKMAMRGSSSFIAIVLIWFYWILQCHVWMDGRFAVE